MPETQPPRRYALLDRDGTINLDTGYLADPAGFELLPGALVGLKRLVAAGFGLVVVTNQSGIARGLIRPAALEAIHERMCQLLAPHGIRFDAIEICPHGPDEGCDCRKPSPGMVRRAAARLGFDPTRAVVFGDKPSDMGLARAVGAMAVLIGDEAAAGASDPAPDLWAPDLDAAARLVIDDARPA
ncbi:HAD family hydrolase [Tistrella mobilis]|uniref:D,D-heptose 1,7-bisphosphate phosphatase n=1 Tax=Tistrella mobilis TaxID=171437 RepID=A0A162JPF8_9PROT|nr:HAD family hydrolase [Tistrella mobilis]KYO49592.1 HAD family hydrolase [Tistrella mobilis]